MLIESLTLHMNEVWKSIRKFFEFSKCQYTTQSCCWFGRDLLQFMYVKQGAM